MASHVKGQRGFHTDTSLYVVHRIVNHVSWGNVKHISRTSAPISFHNGLGWGENYYAKRGLRLDTLAFNT